MKSFNLNNGMREELAKKITTQAIQTELLKWNSEVKRINGLFWEKHCIKIVEAGLKKSLWDGLMQNGVVTSAFSISPKLAYKEKNNTYYNDVYLMNKTEREQWIKTVNVSSITDSDQWFSSLSYGAVTLKFTSKKPVPSITRADLISLDDDMLQMITAVKEWFKKIHQAARQCYRQTMAVLSSCRTYRQLENIFPEAAKMLPQPVQKIANEVAPVELIANIQTMLKSGISTNK